MVALITSTLVPTSVQSVYSPQERSDQTVYTIKRLLAAGFKDIYLFDNSIQDIDKNVLINAYPLLKIYHCPQYSFENKGLSEALLILNNIHHLPANIPIFKISGRYYPGDGFTQDIYNDHSDKDFVGIGYDFHKKISGFSTKAYFVKDVKVLHHTLVKAVEDMVSYSKGIHGLGSAVSAIKEIFKPSPGVKYQLSIEQSFARIIKQKDNFTLLNKMFIEGYEATALKNLPFAE